MRASEPERSCSPDTRIKLQVLNLHTDRRPPCSPRPSSPPPPSPPSLAAPHAHAGPALWCKAGISLQRSPITCSTVVRTLSARGPGGIMLQRRSPERARGSTALTFNGPALVVQGVSFNGLTLNGHEFQGLGLNGIWKNGPVVQGYTARAQHARRALASTGGSSRSSSEPLAARRYPSSRRWRGEVRRNVMRRLLLLVSTLLLCGSFPAAAQTVTRCSSKPTGPNSRRRCPRAACCARAI